MKKIDKIVPKIDPCGYTDMLVSSLLFQYLIEHIVYNLLNKNKCSTGNHYLACMLRVCDQ